MVLALSSTFFAGLCAGLILPKLQILQQQKPEPAKKKTKNSGWLESADYIVGKYED